eukprot:gene5645-6515_t
MGDKESKQSVGIKTSAEFSSPPAPEYKSAEDSPSSKDDLFKPIDQLIKEDLEKIRADNNGSSLATGIDAYNGRQSPLTINSQSEDIIDHLSLGKPTMSTTTTTNSSDGNMSSNDEEVEGLLGVESEDASDELNTSDEESDDERTIRAMSTDDQTVSPADDTTRDTDESDDYSNSDSVIKFKSNLPPKKEKVGKKAKKAAKLQRKATINGLLKDKKLADLRCEATNSPLFSPTEFVKTPASHSVSHSVGGQHSLGSSVMGFQGLGASNLLAVQNPQIIPSTTAPLAPTNPMMSSMAPPFGNTLPDTEFLQTVLDDNDYFVVPTSAYPILDIDHLFTDLSMPAGQPMPTTPGSGTPRGLAQSHSVSDIPGGIPNFSKLSINDPSPAASTATQQKQATAADIPMDLKISQLSGSRIYFNRELTELIYFYRILYEAYNSTIPVIEKIRFLAITSQNIDMYFCKRALKLRLGYISTRKSLKPEERYINMVLNTTRNLINDKYNLFMNILLPELAANNVFLLKYEDLGDAEKFQLRAFFLQHVFPLMTPLVVDAGHPFPNLSNLSLNIAVSLQHDEEGHTRFVRIKVPQKIPRFVHIKQRSPYSMIAMEEIILANLDTLFPNTKILTKSLFRVTRHYDLKLNEADANDLLELIKTELHKRKFAPMVRLEVSSSMPKNIVEMLRIQLHLDEADLYIINGPLGLSDLFEICKLNLPHLKFEPWIPHIPSRLVNLSKFPTQDIFSVIRKGELLINLPYVSFNSTVQFFIESAVKDPKVLAIKIAIYRTSSNSPLIRALCEAASHKEVSVLVDLKASGDEEQNTKYARLLEQAGCHVSYGLVGLKTHAKIAMVVREEENGLREYLHYSTGNYNASTADVYADMGLFSCDQQLGADMCDLFNYLTGYSRITSFRKLLIAPMNMRSTLIELIENEAKNAHAGKPAQILAVMNGLDDKRIVNALYQASVAGVTIKLVVRGRCRILPGIPGISHNIKVISILGRFLEHSRIYYFQNGDKPKAYIASADWLHRNLKRRVETLVPVDDPNNIKELLSVIDVYCKDPNAWEMLPDGRYRKPATSEYASMGSQHQYEEEIMRLKKQLEQVTGGGGVGGTVRDLNSPSTFRSNSPAPSAGGQPRNTPTPIMPDKAPRRQRSNSGEGDMGEMDENGKEDKNGADWLVGYNPNVQTNLNIDLMHTLNHNSVVCCVKFSNDGKYLATGCNRSAQIYEVDTGKNNFYDEADKEGDLYIRSVCFSPDGKYLATGAEDKTVKVWDIAHKKVVHVFSGHELDIYSLDYSGDGRYIVSGSGDKKAKIWDLKEGKCAFTLGNEEVGPKNGVTSVAISPDGRLVAAGSLDNIVRLWDAHTGYFLERYEGHMDSVYSVSFSPDGKSLASGSLDKSLKLWDLTGNRSRTRCRSTFNGHKDFVLSVAFSPCGNWLISGSKDRSVQFWDPRTGTTHMMLQGHKNSVISVALSPKGGVFATGSGDYRARLWKYDT